MNKHCKICNDEFELDIGYDAEHCDEACARMTYPHVVPRFLIVHAQSKQPVPVKKKEGIFSYYINAIKNRGRTPKIEPDKIIYEEYARLKKRAALIQGDIPTNPEWEKE